MGPLLDKEIITFFKPKGTRNISSGIIHHEDIHIFASKFLFKEFKKYKKLIKKRTY